MVTKEKEKNKEREKKKEKEKENKKKNKKEKNMIAFDFFQMQTGPAVRQGTVLRQGAVFIVLLLIACSGKPLCRAG